MLATALIALQTAPAWAGEVITAGPSGAKIPVAIDRPYQAALLKSYKTAARRDYVSAIAPLKKLSRQNPQDYIVQLRLGYLYYLKKSYAPSVEYYTRAVRLRPSAVEPRLGLMLPLMAAKRYSRAIKIGQSILMIDPVNYTAISRMAFSLYLSRKYPGAIVQYRRLVQLYPADVTMRVGLGWSYLMDGQKNKARREFEKVLLISPANKLALDGYRRTR